MEFSDRLKKEYRILVDGELVVPDSLEQWAHWFGDIDQRRIADTVINGIHISTVCLGLDHSFGHGKPLWYETMIFGGEHDEFQMRYETLEEAMRGHESAVHMVQDDYGV